MLTMNYVGSWWKLKELIVKSERKHIPFIHCYKQNLTRHHEIFQRNWSLIVSKEEGIYSEMSHLLLAKGVPYTDSRILIKSDHQPSFKDALDFF